MFFILGKYFSYYKIIYLSVNTVVGVVGLAMFVHFAKQYKLRERDEPCHVRRFVEEYYSKIQQEEHYD